MNYHNVRNKNGQFAKKNTVRAGCLYDFKGLTVRARQMCNNGYRLVSLHNTLFGFALDRDLQKVNNKRVSSYLKV
jgi:hypothetical protein